MNKHKATIKGVENFVFGSHVKGFSIKSKKAAGIDQPKPKIKEFKPKSMGKKSVY